MACYAQTYQRNTLYLQGFLLFHFGDTPQTAEESTYQPNALQLAGFEGRALCADMCDITPEPLAPTGLRSFILYLLCFKKIYKAIINKIQILVFGFYARSFPYNFLKRIKVVTIAQRLVVARGSGVMHYFVTHSFKTLRARSLIAWYVVL